MNQYALEPLEHRLNIEPYREWSIAAPTTRRLDLYVHPGAAETRLELVVDTHGDNGLSIFVSRDEYQTVRTCEAMRRRVAEWRLNRPRYGTWSHYHVDVELVRAVLAHLGWTLTPQETRLMDALEEYGRNAPARYRTAA